MADSVLAHSTALVPFSAARCLSDFHWLIRLFGYRVVADLYDTDDELIDDKRLLLEYHDGKSKTVRAIGRQHFRQIEWAIDRIKKRLLLGDLERLDVDCPGLIRELWQDVNDLAARFEQATSRGLSTSKELRLIDAERLLYSYNLIRRVAVRFRLIYSAEFARGGFTDDPKVCRRQLKMSWSCVKEIILRFFRPSSTHY